LAFLMIYLITKFMNFYHKDIITIRIQIFLSNGAYNI